MLPNKAYQISPSTSQIHLPNFRCERKDHLTNQFSELNFIVGPTMNRPKRRQIRELNWFAVQLIWRGREREARTVPADHRIQIHLASCGSGFLLLGSTPYGQLLRRAVPARDSGPRFTPAVNG